jgi:hypothetical protein
MSPVWRQCYMRCAIFPRSHEKANTKTYTCQKLSNISNFPHACYMAKLSHLFLCNNDSIKWKVRHAKFVSLPITKLRYQPANTILYNTEYSFRLHDAIIGHSFYILFLGSQPSVQLYTTFSWNYRGFVQNLMTTNTQCSQLIQSPLIKELARNSGATRADNSGATWADNAA